MGDKTQKLFIYGTLRDPRVQRKVFGQIVEMIPDKLCGYTTQEIEINKKIYFALVPRQGNYIDGFVLELNNQ